MFADQALPRVGYPAGQAKVERLPGGETVLVRPVRLSDEPALQDLFYMLSDESTFRRFMAHKRVHPHEEMQSLCDLDYTSSMALVACAGEDHGGIVAMARYDVDPSTSTADIGFVVTDAWQSKGVGSLLLRRMGDIAHAAGLAGFTADVLVENKPMIRLFQKSGMDVRFNLEGSAYRIHALFSAPAPKSDTA